MAGSSLLALLDDIATVLDDVVLMSKVAAKKTAGVLGDDLALNAQQVSGVRADRELPGVWRVANKCDCTATNFFSFNYRWFVFVF
ncbi:MAG: putative DNA repair protein MutK [Pseudohongiellaceae bacterium]|jgi:predicted DNA repair protein MutK